MSNPKLTVKPLPAPSGTLFYLEPIYNSCDDFNNNDDEPTELELMIDKMRDEIGDQPIT